MAKKRKKPQALSVVQQVRIKTSIHERYVEEAEVNEETTAGYIRRVLELLAESDPKGEYNLVELAKAGGDRNQQRGDLSLREALVGHK